MSLKFGCSYFGTRYVRHFKEDLKDIKQYCDYLIIPFSEVDVKWYKGTTKSLITEAKKTGLKVYCDPWRVWKVFGGESLSEFNGVKSLMDSKLLKYMGNWLKLVKWCGSDGIFIDEPRGNNLEEFVTYISKYAYRLSLEVTICLLPRTPFKIWEKLAQLKEIKTIATDPYFIWKGCKILPLTYVSKMVERLQIIEKKYSKEIQLWVQGFRLKIKNYPAIMETIQYAYEKGIKDIAVWSYRGTEAMSELSVEDPELYWNNITGKILELKGGKQ